MVRRFAVHLRNQWMGALALFLVLSGGTAYALAGSNTVFTDDITDGNVTSADIKDGGILYGDIKDGAITGRKILDNSMTGTDINEGTLAIPKIHTTAVSLAGAKVLGTGTATHIGTGVYAVDYGFPVTNCTAQATTGSLDAVASFANHAETEVYPGWDDVDDTVRVFFVQEGQAVDTSFFLTLVCP